MGQIFKRYLEYFSSYNYFSKPKRRTQTCVWMTKYDLTFTKAESLTEEEVCAIERSYPYVGVGHILEGYLEYFSSYIFQNLNTKLKHGFKWQSVTWPWPRQKVKLRKGYVLLKCLTLRLVWAKYEFSILNTSAVMSTFQNLNAKLKHECKWQSKNWPWPI